jgi:N6-L-threonylcarbamoyladenine synthase
MKVLGIETSCDETSVAIVDENKNIIANLVYSQIKEHIEFQGVVPELAARAHMEKLELLINEALSSSALTLNDLDAIAVTAGPGLIGGLIVGVMYAKALAATTGKPLYAINHLEGHALTARLTNDVEFPYLLLLVSGGHTQILIAEQVGKYQLLGSTIDDAIGEAFDKVAKMLEIGYPGGPAVEKLALTGRRIFEFPKPLIREQNCNFSLSGLKTAVRRKIESLGELDEQAKADICASFQYTIGEIISNRINNAFLHYTHQTNKKSLVVAGGVACNQYIRKILEQDCIKHNCNFIAPPIRLCTDNAAMIAWAGIEKILAKNKPDSLDFAPKSRWNINNFNV